MCYSFYCFSISYYHYHIIIIIFLLLLLPVWSPSPSLSSHLHYCHHHQPLTLLLLRTPVNQFFFLPYCLMNKHFSENIFNRLMILFLLITSIATSAGRAKYYISTANGIYKYPRYYYYYYYYCFC